VNRRIILDPKPRRPQLPAYTEIDHKEIREAAAAWDAAKTTLESARKDLTELEQTREAAEWRDAETAEKARAEGKAEPKRTHVAAHDRKTDEARHEFKVAQLAETRTFDELQAALDEHQIEWAQSIERDVQTLDDEWTAALNALITLHAQRSRVLAIRAQVVGEGRRAASALGFKPSQIRDLDFATGTNDRQMTGYVAVGDVFGRLADLGMPEPPAPEPVQHPPLRPNTSNLLRGQAGVEDEIAERRRFAELTARGD
jgi:hypothetical protein